MDYSKLQAEIEEEFAKEFPDTYVEDDWEYEEALTPTLTDVIAEMQDAYITDAVKHFLSFRSRTIADDGYYFYQLCSLKTFLERFKTKGGDTHILHVGIVYAEGSFLCYEVCRKEYYEEHPEYFLSGCKEVKQNG